MSSANVEENPRAARGDDAWPLPWEPVEGDRDGLMAHLEAGATRGLIGLLARLPWPLQRGLVRLLARAARAVDRRHSASARAFLAQAFGPELTRARREELILCAYEHLFTMTLEMERFGAVVLEKDLREHFDVTLSDDFRRAVSQERGVLFLVAHVGMWEILPLIAAHFGIGPAYVVSRPPRNKPLSRTMQRAREAHGIRLLHRRGAAQTVPRAIKGGASVALMVDQRAHTKTVLAPFFGRLAHCERTVAVFARRLGVPVVFLGCYRTPRRWHYEAEFGPVLWPEDLAGCSVEDITARINAEFERMILARPEQYFWLHDRYRDAPPTGEG